MTDAVFSSPPAARTQRAARKIGVLPGEGIGPEVVAAALEVLDALEAHRSLGIARITGGPIGLKASKDGNVTHDTSKFCMDVFEDAGALFCGPGGGRWVYDLRQKFDLFCKIAPLTLSPHLRSSSRMRPEALAGVDMVVVRDNSAGVYQGREEIRTEDGDRIAEHTYGYRESQVERIVAAGSRLALMRRGKMHVIVKEGGVQVISDLWKKTALRVVGETGVECKFLNVDYAAYLMLQTPWDFDVIVTPNMIGDILADLGGVLIGSRGLTFSGNFSTCGRGVYQTGHGAAYDLAGSGRANPCGQILALAMMLRESFGLDAEAAIVEGAVEEVWRNGIRTDDLCWAGTTGVTRVGTREMTDHVIGALEKLARRTVSSSTIRVVSAG